MRPARRSLTLQLPDIVRYLDPCRHDAAAVIGEVLGSIDDLIENNRRRVEVLEEMARAIYREWFVKFRYPGHEDVPLVDSALGPIPEGWEVATSSATCSSIVDARHRARSTTDLTAIGRSFSIRSASATARSTLGPSRRSGTPGARARKRSTSAMSLITRPASRTLGRVAMHRGSPRTVTVDSHVTIARPSDERRARGIGAAVSLPQSRRLSGSAQAATVQTELRAGARRSSDVARWRRSTTRSSASSAQSMLARCRRSDESQLVRAARPAAAEAGHRSDRRVGARPRCAASRSAVA